MNTEYEIRKLKGRMECVEGMITSILIAALVIAVIAAIFS